MQNWLVHSKTLAILEELTVLQNEDVSSQSEVWQGSWGSSLELEAEKSTGLPWENPSGGVWGKAVKTAWLGEEHSIDGPVHWSPAQSWWLKVGTKSLFFMKLIWVLNPKSHKMSRIN